MATTYKFKFGNRVDATWSILPGLRTEVRYLRYLVQQKFHINDDLVQYFYFNRFHDGPIIINEIDLLKSRIGFTFKNVSAFDRACELAPKKAKGEHFITKVMFINVSRFSIRNFQLIRRPFYNVAEFWREGSEMEIKLYALDETNINNPMGVISIRFQTVKVENISSRLSRYGSIEIQRKILEPHSGKTLKSLLVEKESLIRQYKRKV